MPAGVASSFPTNTNVWNNWKTSSK